MSAFKDNIVDEIENYQQDWLQQVHKMENGRLQKKSALQYQLHGKRKIRRPRRRWRIQEHLRANGGLQRTGLTALNLQRPLLLLLLLLLLLSSSSSPPPSSLISIIINNNNNKFKIHCPE